MVPIRMFRNGELVDIKTGEFHENILKVCNEHKLRNRALAFALILYNFKNPQIYKILEDKHYWRAMNETSGKYLSIFYISQYEDYFGQDLSEHAGMEPLRYHKPEA